MTRLALPSPAKLNLFLHITGQRPDGYHTLQTVFQLLDYGDELVFEVTNDPNIILSSSLPQVAVTDNYSTGQYQYERQAQHPLLNTNGK